MATSLLVKELELVTQAEPVISVFSLKQPLEHYSVHACEETATTAALSVQTCEETAMPPALAEPQSLDIKDQDQPRLMLSGREAAILGGLVLGAANKVIAYQLKITEATVKVHVKAILRKIRVKNRTQAAI
jgi:DNA-binding NarL/FixJ family response regulator